MEKIAYIANIRLPTEKAHGFQICKMCEAMAQHGTAVSLYHPHRRQTTALVGQTGVDAFDYYNIDPIFTIHTTPNLDVIRTESLLPRKLYRGAYSTHAQIWGWITSKTAQKNGATLYFTRDIPIADVLTRQGLPTIFEAHAVPEGRDKMRLMQLFKRPSLRLTIVLTQFIRHAFIQLGASPERIIREPDAIDLADFAQLPSQKEARQQLGLPQEKTIIGYIGRFKTMGMDKGINTLIEAMAHLPYERRANSLLLCVGGPMTAVPAYHALANHLNLPESTLQFKDRVPNKMVPLWIRALDIATLPLPFNTHFAYYASSMKLFEYMAAGRVILATDLPTAREILTHKTNGWLVLPEDAEAMAAGMMTLLSQPEIALKLSQTAQINAAEYTWSARVSRILEMANA
jgi:glycosyltransferase involved in cell wall biosynthesis